MRSAIYAILPVVLAALFASCGGGGGGGGEKDAQNAAPCVERSDPKYSADDFASQRISARDPLSAYQWHLKNFRFSTGNDINVEKVFKGVAPLAKAYTGAGVTIVITDDGVQASHPDLSPNLNLNLSGNSITGKHDPSPVNIACTHGTMVAGIAAAKGGNDQGVIGVAPNATIVAINVADPKDAKCNNLSFWYFDVVYRLSSYKDGLVFSNSWGGEAFSQIRQNDRDAIKESAAYNKAIHIFAAGNERQTEKSRSDYNERRNIYESLPIAALKINGGYADYSNPGASLLVSAYATGAQGSGDIVTTFPTGCLAGFMRHKLAYGGGYTEQMNGTSAATPMAAGVVALMLEANPNLTFREVRYILAKTARQNNSADSDWKTNGAGFHINHNYGFGAVDAFEAVKMAEGFSNFSQLVTTPTYTQTGGGAINVSDSGINKIEFVEIAAKIKTTCSFDLTLTSPKNTTAQFVKRDFAPDSSVSSILANGFNFGTPRFLDEAANGSWTLTIPSGSFSCPTTIDSWKLTIKGRS
ncbi:MAG: S8 family serine peptidase [Helicobacteraceae bacterium]|jgi:kexin|nr:S8 family serine peptidase [Helicobacteraceae bacterium]